MDKLTKYRSIIVAILQRHAQFTNSDDNAESCAICDEKTDNYLLSDVGWHASGLRLHSFPIHVRLKEDKFWIEWDGTEYGVANELMDAGVRLATDEGQFIAPEGAACMHSRFGETLEERVSEA